MISLVLPAHNEARSIRDSVCELDRELSRVFADTEILVVDDGSTDQTLGQLNELNLNSQLILIRRDRRSGKGSALRTGFLLARGTVVAYTDADMPISPASVARAIAEVDSGACDVCVGDRDKDSSSSTGSRQRLRMLASWAYKKYVRLFFTQLPRDPACCLKAFSREVALRVAANATLDNYHFDVEALVISSCAGADIKEIPVTWIDKRSRLPLIRLLSASFQSLRMAINLKRKYSRAAPSHAR